MRRENWTQRNAMVAQIVGSSATKAAGSYYSDVVTAGLYDRLVAVTEVTFLQGTATLLGKWQHCSASNGTFVDISSASCTTSTFTSAANGSTAHLELRLDQNPSVSAYVQFCAQLATSTGFFNVHVFGEPNYQPAKDVDLAAVVQIVTY